MHWVDCLRSGALPESAGEDNLRALPLVFGVYESAENYTAYRLGAGNK